MLAKIAGLAFLPALLAGCSTAPVPSEFGDAAVARSRPVVKKRLNCKDERSIRDFKDYVLADVNPDADEVERWTVCICGDAARRAGINGVRPRPTEIIPAFPAYDLGSPDQSLSNIREWFKGNIPVTEAQAAKLTECLYGKP